jgi:NDP-sugar pyrophosphorylase family protein
MDFAVIAAGEGSRLREEGFEHPKPMVRLHGMPLIHRLINLFLQNGAERILVIINEYSPEVEAYLQTLSLPVPLVVIKKNTPSSLHSFYELASQIRSERFCLTTVDTVFEEEAFARYIAAFRADKEYDGLLAVTPFVDDEKPLYVRTGGNLLIEAFEDSDTGKAAFVSGGVYGLHRRVVPIVRQAVEGGTERMRNFQRLMLQEGLRLKAFPFDKIVDIDHVRDIGLAEEWLMKKETVTDRQV